MPSGGTPSFHSLDPRASDYIRDCLFDALEYDLELEFIDWLIGGIISGKSPIEAAQAALIEWDIIPPPLPAQSTPVVEEPPKES